MAIDTEVLVVALLAVGIIAFSVNNSKDAGVEKAVNKLGEVMMELDTVDKWDPEKVAKKADLGDLEYRGRQIIQYLLDKGGWCYAAQGFFENGMQNRDALWLRENNEEMYRNLQAVIRQCRILDKEFRMLWGELSQMDNGRHAWMAANQWVVNVPLNVANSLQRFFQLSPDSILNYQNELKACPLLLGRH